MEASEAVVDDWEEAAVDDWEAMDLDEIKLPGQVRGCIVCWAPRQGGREL